MKLNKRDMHWTLHTSIKSKNKVSSTHIAGLASLCDPCETIWHHSELPLSVTWTKVKCFPMQISLPHSWETVSRHFGDQSPACGQASVVVLNLVSSTVYCLVGSLHPIPVCRSLSPSNATCIPWEESLWCGMCTAKTILRTNSEWLLQFHVLLNL